jgi:hypothetical protein
MPIIASVVLVFMIAAAASGQMRGHAGSMRGVAVRPAAVRPVGVRPVHVNGVPISTTPGSSVVVSTGVSTTPIVSTGFTSGVFGFPTPGLGFDFPHLAAVNGNLGVRALIDPVTQAQIALALRLQAAAAPVSPFLFSGFGGVPIVMESPAPVIVVQQAPVPAPQAPAEEPRPAVTVTQSPIVPQEPPRDAGEFVLVQRDGRLLFAVGFTAEPGRVVYVTREGLRRTIRLEQLDVDATLRMNEERGTSIQLPRA